MRGSGKQNNGAVIASGLPIVGFHPRANRVAHFTQTLQNAYRSLFPHAENVSAFTPLRYQRAPDELRCLPSERPLGGFDQTLLKDGKRDTGLIFRHADHERCFDTGHVVGRQKVAGQKPLKT